MNRNNVFKAAVLAGIGLTSILATQSASAAMLITEVNPAGSGTTSGYAADWFELTNTDSSAVDITGWKMDDNSFNAANSVALQGVTSILGGQSVIFLETTATDSTSVNTVFNNFKSAWFGSNVPSSLVLGYYSGSGVGLGTAGDGVIVFNGSTQMAKVIFGAATAGKTFDNTAGLDNTTISTVSAAGVNGAFLSNNGAETGSPGVAPVPVPAAGWMLLSGLGSLGILSKRKKSAK